MNPNVGKSVNPLANLDSVVVAAQQEAVVAAQAPPTLQEQFRSQFGSEITPPVAETPADIPIAPLDPNIKIVSDLLTKDPETNGVAPQQEDPQAVFVQDIKHALGKLEEATREKAAV